jgi:hypothetical protein
MSAWNPLIARLSIFPVPTPAPQQSALDIFRQVLDQDPESFNKPANILASSVAQAQLTTFMVQCVSGPGRIDMNLTSAPALGDMSIPTIADARGLSDLLKSIAPKVGNVVESASRIAAFVQFVHEAPEIASANKTLLEVMPPSYCPTLSDETDFVFQINKPQASESGLADLNLLTKWSVDKLTMQTVLSVPGQMVSGVDHVVASVGLDFNTVPGPSVHLRRESQGRLLSECLNLISARQKNLGLNVTGF